MSTSPSLIETTKKKINNLLQSKKPWVNRAIKYVWVLLIAFILGLPLYIFTVSIDLFGLFGPMPNTKDIENPTNDLASELISADGVSLGSYARFNRSQVAFNELSEELRNTLVISEDIRFYNHSGLDLKAYLRAIRGLLTFSPAGGGSTITQQLAKNLFTKAEDRSLDGAIAKLGKYPKRLVQKTKEWIISVNLEENFTKEEILAMYLNTSNFSSNAFGIKVAAKTYFNKLPSELNLQESTLLIGMLQAPSFYNPKYKLANALKKRNEVLYKIYKEKYKIKTRAQFDSIKALPIELDYKVQNQNQGLATYFRTMASKHLMDWCKEKGIDLWNSGLKIYTTIDSRMQRYAEEAVTEKMSSLQVQFDREWKARKRNPWVDENWGEIKDFLQKRIKKTDAYEIYSERYGENSDSLKIMLNKKKAMTIFTWKGERDTLFSSMDSLNYYERFLQTGMLSIDPNTGFIKAWVGGINHKYFKYDHVKQGTRQPGSTFKAFVYGLAIESGYSPCLTLKDISPTFKLPEGGTYTPKNSEPPWNGTGEEMTIRQAMARSVNSITAQLVQQLGPQNVVDFAHNMGIKSYLNPVPSICLGVSDVSLYEMVSAYSTFVNGGVQIEPIFITRIEDKNGNVIENFIPKTKEVINDQIAYKMVYMLRGGVEEQGGSSNGLPGDLRVGNEIGGKTGTTDDASDGWYMGITRDLVSGVWVGGDERAIHFPSWGFGQGAKTARPIWSTYMQKVYADTATGIKKGYFKKPASGLDLSFDCHRDVPDSVQVDDVPFDIKN
jgi:penicillin-binding protein 1A